MKEEGVPQKSTYLKLLRLFPFQLKVTNCFLALGPCNLSISEGNLFPYKYISNLSNAESTKNEYFWNTETPFTFVS